ncbi:hypothetical protein GDO78_017861 [Eleutherodactylus coqui]|uniref:Uncharacterized protein n=1 Tax=Eleutherodactylus coqui TaxID=57060 RepID=A0A8J6BD63_ELECQ|nr:hypothetical protein GDO78_017861 [Eleutherodactylus coqui]
MYIYLIFCIARDTNSAAARLVCYYGLVSLRLRHVWLYIQFVGLFSHVEGGLSGTCFFAVNITWYMLQCGRSGRTRRGVSSPVYPIKACIRDFCVL